MHIQSLNDRWNVFRLIFENVADPVQEFPGDLDNGLRLAHFFAVLIEGHHKRRVLPDCNPGGLDQQPSQLRMAPLRHPLDMFFLTAFLNVWNQSNVTAQFVDRSKTCNLTKFRQQNHGRKRADPWDRPQQTDQGAVLLRPGQLQDDPVQSGDQLAQMLQFLQVSLKSYISAAPFHPNLLNPLNKSSGPMAPGLFFRKIDTIKQKHPFDLVFTSRLLPNHALTGPDQAAIFQLRPARGIDPFDLPIPKTSGQFTAIDPIPFGPSLLVLGRDVSRVHYDTLDSFLLQLVMNPEAAIARFINCIIPSTRKVMSQVVDQFFHFRELAKRFVLAMFRINAYTPTLFVHIQTDVLV